MPELRNHNTAEEGIEVARREAARQEAEFREALADGRKALELLGKLYPLDWGTPRQREDYRNRTVLREAKRRCRELLREVQSRRAAGRPVRQAADKQQESASAKPAK